MRSATASMEADQVSYAFPASFAQARMWFLAQLAPESTAYNVPLALRLTGHLNVAALEASLSEIVRRHEVLRTTLAGRDGAVLQVVHPPTPISLPLRTVPATEVNALLDAEIARPFNLATDLPVRTQLMQPEGEDELHILLLTFHHAAVDGWSAGLLLEELSRTYPAHLVGQPTGLPEPAVQYADYAVWQHDMLRRGTYAGQLAYWRDRLAGAPTLLELPTDRQRPAVSSFQGGQQDIRISADVVTGLHRLGRAEGATLFMVLLTALQALLARWSGQQEFCLGTPVAGRTRSELVHLIGFFVNTVIMRAGVSGDSTFRSLLRAVRDAALAAFDNQDVPFEHVVELLCPERSLSHHPLFQATFVLQNLAHAAVEIPSLHAEIIQRPGKTAKFDIALIASECDDGTLLCTFEYATDLFDPSTIKRLAHRYAKLLNDVITEPDRRIANFSITLDEERHAQLVTWNAAAATAESGVCLHQLFERQVMARPDAAALSFERRTLSYGELNSYATLVSRSLRFLGVGPESLVAICMERSPELVIGLLGVLKADAAYVPLDPSDPADRLVFMLSDSGAKVLLTQQHLLADMTDLCRSLNVTVLTVDDEGRVAPNQTGSAAQPYHSRVIPDNAAYMIYTSGSTGRPKGAVITHRSIVTHLTIIQDAFPLGPGDTVLQKTQISFDVSVWELFWPLLLGARLVMAAPDGHRDPAYLRRLIDSEKIGTAHFVPSMLAAFLADLKEPICPSLRRVVCSGEELSRPLVESFFRNLDCELYNLYGPTEATIHASAWKCEPTERGRVPIGRPVPGTRLYVLDEWMEPVPIGSPGHLHIGGAQLARCYHARPKLTAERFVPDPYGPLGSRLYRTGDLARLRPNGVIEFLGRIDHQVKIRGRRIELGEIETALRIHPLVRQALVLVRSDPRGDPVLVAYTVPANAGKPPTAAALCSHVAALLPSYMVPTSYVGLTAWPLTSSGKVDRTALPMPATVQPSGGTRGRGPRTPTERLIAQLWSDLLQLERVGRDDNFFALGGHSLSALRMVSRLGVILSLDVPAAAVFRCPTVQQLAAWLDGRQRDRLATTPPARETPLVALRETGSWPPLFLAHPIGGNILCYGQLARALAAEQPVYGLVASGVADGEEPLATIESMAAAYLTAIARSGQDRPCVFGGWSMGGLIGYEMARQLHRATGRVAPVVMLDSYVLTTSQRAAVDEAAIAADFANDWGKSVGINLGLSPEDLRGLPRKRAIEEIMTRFELLGAQKVVADAALLDRLIRVFAANARAIERYSPPNGYPGPILLLAAEQAGLAPERREQDLRAWTTGRIDVRVVPGDHYSMLREPHLTTVAAQVGAALGQRHGQALNWEHGSGPPTTAQ